MPRRGRPFLVAAVAGAVVAGTAGVAIGSQGSDDHVRRVEVEVPAVRTHIDDSKLDLPKFDGRTIKLPNRAEIKLPDFKDLNGSWNEDVSFNDDDVIRTTKKHCPKSHPHQVGTFSNSSSSQVNGGTVHRNASRGRYCSR
jgi:hypothetical protein